MAVLSRYVPADLSGRRAVIVGAGIAGLACALALGERGAAVVVVDSDAAPTAETADEAFFDWPRRHVPQIRHSHAFLARLRSILLAAYPDFHRSLIDAGAVELRLLDHPPAWIGRLAPEPGDERLAAIGCRRTTFEWLLRRYVLARGVDILCETRATGLVATGGKPPRVGGLHVLDRRGRRRQIAADLVVDAAGRRSRAPEWLAAIGAEPPEEERSPSYIVYYTRFFRRFPDTEWPRPGREPTMGDFGWLKFAVFPADDSTYSLTFAAHSALPRLKVLASGAAFDELAQTLPGLRPFVSPKFTQPLVVGGREVLPFGGLENCLRRFVDRRHRPLAAGFFAIGDSAYHTNPLYGRGSSQAFMHAGLLGEALDAASGDVERAAGFLDDAAREEIEPFYHASVAADRVASRKVGAARGEVSERVWDSFFDRGVVPASLVDPIVFRTMVEVMNMVDTPERAFTRPEVAERVLAVWLRGRKVLRQIAPTVPDRDATIARLEEIAAGRAAVA